MKTLLIMLFTVLLIHPSRAQPDKDGAVIRIPVIFHVIYADRDHSRRTDGGNTIENLPASLLLKELEDLHKDFMLLNTDTDQVISLYKSRIGKADIDFYIADTILQPGGEHGIKRVGNSSNGSKLYKRSAIINPKKYLNVYIGNIGGSLAYSQRPWELEDRDAVFLAFDWVGLGYRLLTHEAGHWCGLLHLWGTGGGKGDRNSCPVGDSIADTPAQTEATQPGGACDDCPPPIGTAVDKTCVAGTPSNFNNFMDYSGCRRMFTQQQVVAMRNAIRDHRKEIWGN